MIGSQAAADGEGASVGVVSEAGARRRAGSGVCSFNFYLVLVQCIRRCKGTVWILFLFRGTVPVTAGAFLTRLENASLYNDLRWVGWRGDFPVLQKL